MIKNITRNKIISINEKICDSHFSKALGLMFSLKKKTLVFRFANEQKVPLHMLFVFYPIDVLFLDGKKKVVEIKRKLMPFWFYNPEKKSSYVIEVPAGLALGTKIGDKIIIGKAK